MLTAYEISLSFRMPFIFQALGDCEQQSNGAVASITCNTISTWEMEANHSYRILRNSIQVSTDAAAAEDANANAASLEA